MLEESEEKSFQNEDKTNKQYSSDHERYKTLFESINAAAFITDLNGKVIESNLKSSDLLGYGWEELNKMNLESIFPEEIE